jgi:hypothetical protein
VSEQNLLRTKQRNLLSVTRKDVVLTINAVPGTPTANNVEYCQDDTAQVLTATASNSVNNLYYFGSLTSTPQTTLIPTQALGSFTYYVAEELIHVLLAKSDYCFS